MPDLGRLSQDDGEFETSLGYRVRTCHKNKNKKSKEANN
jgi:hypothetical protein